MLIPKERFVVTRDPLKVLKENRSTVVLINSDRVQYSYVKLDEAVEYEEGEEAVQCCDYLVLFDGRCYFIELKGGNIGDALGQLQDAITCFSAIAGCSESIPVIVGRGVPSIAGLQKEARKKKKRIDYSIFGNIRLGSVKLEIVLGGDDLH